jgi:hypothetical protein
MAWKNWPYWLKGGVIGLFYGILSATISYILFKPHNSASVEGSVILIILNIFSTWPLLVGLLPYIMFWYIGALTHNSVLMAIAFFISNYRNIFGVIGLTLIGAFIGWIVGKIKEKK